MDQKSISEIVVTDRDVSVDSIHFTIPVPLQILKDMLGIPAIFKGKYNTVYTWHDLGIRAYSSDKVNVQSLGLDFQKHRTYSFTPTSLYNGTYYSRSEGIF